MTYQSKSTILWKGYYNTPPSSGYTSVWASILAELQPTGQTQNQMPGSIQHLLLSKTLTRFAKMQNNATLITPDIFGTENTIIFHKDMLFVAACNGPIIIF